MQPYERLEKEYGEWKGCQRDPGVMVACSSGTSALHLALETLSQLYGWSGQPCEKRVVVPDFTMIACARAVTLSGCAPTFEDVDDLGLLPSKYPLGSVGYYTRAIIPVHMYGRPCGYPGARSVEESIPLVEDLAEAHGIVPWPSSVACWSFYRNKVIAGEEGGMVAFRDKQEADLARQLRNMGFDDNHDFNHIPRGMNYRMSNCHAELVLGSLRDYDKNLETRKRIEEEYDKYCPEEWRLPNRRIPWVYDVHLPCRVDPVVKGLNAQRVVARCGFKPLSTQLEYSLGFSRPDLPSASSLAKHRMYLPIFPEIRQFQIKRNVDLLKRAVENQCTSLT